MTAGLLPRVDRVRTEASSLAIRLGLTLPLVAGLGPSLEVAQRVGRAYGRSGVNRARVERAVDRIVPAYPGLDRDGRRELVMQGWEHLAMLAVEIAMSPRLINRTTWHRHIDIGDVGGLMRALVRDRPTILVTGHCGNWEILGMAAGVLGVPMAAVYRPLDLAPLDAWVRRSRRERGLELVDKFSAMGRLPEVLAAGGRPAFVADQNAGDRGMFVPFLGRLASSYKSIGLLAMQHGADVIVSTANRVGPAPGASGGASGEDGGRGGAGRFHLFLEDTITHEEYAAAPDPLFYLTARYRRAIERAVWRHPEQYLWMHRIWKSRPPHERRDRPFPAGLRARLADLPWMSEEDVDRIVDRSDRDRAWLRENGTERLP